MAFRDSPPSASHLTIGGLGLQMCATAQHRFQGFKFNSSLLHGKCFSHQATPLYQPYTELLSVEDILIIK